MVPDLNVITSNMQLSCDYCNNVNFLFFLLRTWLHFKSIVSKVVIFLSGKEVLQEFVLFFHTRESQSSFRCIFSEPEMTVARKIFLRLQEGETFRGTRLKKELILFRLSLDSGIMSYYFSTTVYCKVKQHQVLK